MLKSKTCKDCKKEKDISEFNKSNNGTTYRGNCKKCRKEFQSNYYQNNKEKHKEYRLNNKEKVNENQRKWYQNNKEKAAEHRKKYYESLKLDHYIVYYLPEENYCGVTQNPTKRMLKHKSRGNNPTGWKVLATTKTRQEALTIERKYHTELGMNGANGWKKRAEITN
tara:strand:- start:20 stop:520 length:501 start_codon:yes stop_codon:yes gene_type:complete